MNENTIDYLVFSFLFSFNVNLRFIFLKITIYKCRLKLWITNVDLNERKRNK